jgi:hypothetical protein
MPFEYYRFGLPLRQLLAEQVGDLSLAQEQARTRLFCNFTSHACPEIAGEEALRPLAAAHALFSSSHSLGSAVGG